MHRRDGREAIHALALVLILILIGFVLLFSIQRDPRTGGITINPKLIMLGIFLAIFVYFFLTFPFHKKGTHLRIRFCVACGRNIPFDAVICPYCRHDYEKDIEK
jgi:hypothetical protein